MTLFVRRRWPKVAAAVAVLVALVAVVLLVARPGDDGGGGPGARGSLPPGIVETEEPVPDPTLEPVSFAAVLTASDAELKTYDEQQVTAESVPVQSVASPSAVWVGESAADRVLVVLVSVDQAFRFDAGTRLSFTGVVRRGDAAFAESVGVRGADLAEFRKQGTYVEIEGYEQR